jgi:hypothetical protein
MKNLKKSILISSAVMLGVAGTLYAANTLTIPTRPAKHDAYLSTLVLGDTTTGKYTLSGSNLIVPEKMIAGGIGGMSKNTISDTARFAVIGGGYGNKVNENAENSVIGAGRLNTISAKNAIIGAGNRNVIRVGADGSFIGGGTNNIADSMVSIAG